MLSKIIRPNKLFNRCSLAQLPLLLRSRSMHQGAPSLIFGRFAKQGIKVNTFEKNLWVRSYANFSHAYADIVPWLKKQREIIQNAHDTKKFVLQDSEFPSAAYTYLLAQVGEGMFPELEVIDLESVYLYPEQVALIARGFSKMPNLKEINLSACGIGELGLSRLLIRFKELKSLEKLDLSANDISTESIARLQDVIREEAAGRIKVTF